MPAARNPDQRGPGGPTTRALWAHFVVGAIAIALPIAALGDHGHAIGRIGAADRAVLLLGLLLGPLTGWLLASSPVTTDWYLVNVVTGLTAGPIAVAAGSRSRAAMALAASFWVLGGYFFSVAIWI